MCSLPDFASCRRGLALLAMLGLAAPLGAQTAAETEKEEIPPPEDLTLETRDGVLLRATYFASNRGESAIPLILVHGVDGSRVEFEPLALFLQSKGHAVVTVDLRGHGESLSIRGADASINRERFVAADYMNMVDFDLEAVKSFLKKQHNEKQLNIDLLTVIGAEAGGVIGLTWLMKDWNWPILPGRKQGQDVKAIVLLSPPRSFQRLTTAAALKHPFVSGKLPLKCSMMVLVGRDDATPYREAKSLQAGMERAYPDLDKAEPKDRNFVFIELPTSLQGTKLLDPKLRLVDPMLIETFLQFRVASRAADFPWKERK